MHNWIALITSLPTENASARMRAWRNLKSSGAAVLRDGVYLMPARDDCRATLAGVAADIHAAGGTALVVGLEPPAGEDFSRLFERGGEFAALLGQIAALRAALTPETAQEAQRQVRKLGKSLAALEAIDFFPGEASRQTAAALAELEQKIARTLTPDEPGSSDAAIVARDLAAYCGRVWATRRRPWVDRLASAWLIRRHIDPQARFLWLEKAADCPAEALGFDFDGAAFSHVGGRVTFEVLLASFGLENEALLRLGALVHFLDLGGVQPPEAAGIEALLAGLRDGIADDDRLLAAAEAVFDGLYNAFTKGLKT